MSNEEILKILRELVAEQFAKEPEDITMDTAFEGDLGADSVDLVELVMAMEEEFEVGEIEEEELTSLKTVGDAVNYLANKLNRREAGAEEARPVSPHGASFQRGPLWRNWRKN